MTVIDSDAHVLETARTWDYMEGEHAKFRPMIVSQVEGERQVNFQGVAMNQYWVIDGRIHAKENNVDASTAKESRELSDVSARVNHMNELDIDVQVLYPTLFLRPITSNPDIEFGLCHSYNRWLAWINEQAPERLRWVVCPPILSMDKVREELEFGKKHGACGIFIRAFENEKLLNDAYLYPLYELAGELDLAVCLHAGLNGTMVHEFFRESNFNRFKLTGVGAFHHLLWSDTPEKFPKVRWGFIELSAQWVPYALNDLQLKYKMFRGEEMPGNMLKENNIWVACQTTDDLDYVLSYAGEENLVVGTDYGHHDTSTEIEALRQIRADGKIPSQVCDKILGDNAKSLYGL